MSDVIIIGNEVKIIETCVQPHFQLSEKDMTGFGIGQEQIVYPEILAVTTGMSKNYNMYTEAGLKGSSKRNPQGEKSGWKSLLEIYKKPLLLNHNEDGRPVGRITEAWYTVNGILVRARVGQWEYVQDILSGDLLTVSIGYTTDSAVCSICGHDIVKTKEWCEHDKGTTYGKKKELCFWTIGAMWFREISFVNVPGIPGAQVLQPDTSEDQGADINQ